MNSNGVSSSAVIRNAIPILLGMLLIFLADAVIAAPGDMMGGNGQSLSEDGSATVDSCKEMFETNRTPVSLDFQKASIPDVMQVIADVSGMNIVLAPDVLGTTNVMVTDVPWPTALEVVLDNSKLGRICSKNIIRIATKASLRDLKTKGERVTEMIQLNYSDIKEVATRVKGFLNPNGDVTIDERTNTLVVTDTEPMLKDVLSIVRNLDIPTPQVQIASKIVQVQREFLQELGIQWGFTSVTFRNPEFPNAIFIGGAANSGSSLSTAGPAFTNANLNGLSAVGQNFMVDLATSDNPLFGLGTSLISRDGDLTLDLQLSALERQSMAKVIANPKVSTADNKQAKIRQGKRIPYVSTSQNEGAKVQYVDANLELNVTPHITADQKIYMKIEARRDSPGVAGPGGVLPINTNQATTELLVEDGGTAILGGLHERRLDENRRAIPYLADIPIVGLLFKSTREQDRITELLIFVTPSIIKNSPGNS